MIRSLVSGFCAGAVLATSSSRAATVCPLELRHGAEPVPTSMATLQRPESATSLS